MKRLLSKLTNAVALVLVNDSEFRPTGRYSCILTRRSVSRSGRQHEMKCAHLAAVVRAAANQVAGDRAAACVAGSPIAQRVEKGCGPADCLLHAFVTARRYRPSGRKLKRTQPSCLRSAIGAIQVAPRRIACDRPPRQCCSIPGEQNGVDLADHRASLHGQRGRRVWSHWSRHRGPGESDLVGSVASTMQSEDVRRSTKWPATNGRPGSISSRHDSSPAGSATKVGTGAAEPRYRPSDPATIPARVCSA